MILNRRISPSQGILWQHIRHRGYPSNTLVSNGVPFRLFTLRKCVERIQLSVTLRVILAKVNAMLGPHLVFLT